MTTNAWTWLGLAVLALASLALSALRYRENPDRDDIVSEQFVERLARSEILLLGQIKSPAFRVLRLRRVGCADEIRVAFAPDDGAASVLERVIPGGESFVVPADDGFTRPPWRVLVTNGSADDPCRDPARVRQALER